MRKDLQKRLLTVAALLDRTTAQVKLADGDDGGNFWKKFFHKEPKVAPKVETPDQAEPMPQPKTMIAPEAPRTKEQPAPAQKIPAPQKDPSVPMDEIVNFLQGGPIPLAVINPLAQLAKSLAGAGAIGEKDIKSVVAFMGKMLRKYVGGQKLAIVAEAKIATERKALAGAARKARIAARVEAESAKVNVQNFFEAYPEGERFAAAGLLRELVARNGIDWKEFHRANTEQLAAFITEDGILLNVPAKQASFRDQIAAIVEAKK